MICPDVGGGFGSRTNLYPEQIAVVWAARRVGRPVKWTGDRTEAFLTDYSARDVVTAARLAFDRRRSHAVRSPWSCTGNIGAHTVSYVPLSNGYRVAPTVYDVPVGMGAIARRHDQHGADGAVPRRRDGRKPPPVMERLIDIAARRLGIDRVELRRRNLIRRDRLPHRTATGLTATTAAILPATLRACSLPLTGTAFRSRRRAAKKRGRLLGIGGGQLHRDPGRDAARARRSERVGRDASI